MKCTSPLSAVTLAVLVLGADAFAAPPPPSPPPPHTAVRHHPAPDDAPPPAQASFGAPLPGLSSAEMQRFRAGLDEFNNVETPQSGLGPIFNGPSCVACHGSPAAGGAGLFLATRFGRQDANGFDPLTDLGGSLQQLRAIAPAALEVVPPQANVTAKRQSPPLYGFGLIEAIPDAEIVANAQRPQPDGIHGLPSEVADRVGGGTRIGRFGWKAQIATLLEFAGDAYVNEMGITNRLFPEENAPNGNKALLAQFDHVADPEDTVDPATGEADIDVVADFMRLLAPPPRLPESREAHDGERVFADTGCAACHTPVMQTGPSPIAALDHKPAALYSDLLLHDMGAEGDGIAQAFAAQTEMRTAPLWGLRASAPYLHDGSAPDVDRAIRAHDGEARVVRDRYVALSDRDRHDLLAFLATL
ncbi:MAG: di-heme oxidoredictase family protein [Rudaea sp.]